MCGLRRKILYPEFTELVSQFDIFFVSETKLDDYDIINIDSYDFFSQCRKQKYIRKSGGLGFFIKHTLTPYINIVKSDSDYVMWFKVSKSLVKTSEDILFGVFYIPPPESRFHNVEEIELLEVEITSSCIQNDNVLLTGDFNARTHVQPDILEADDFIVEHFNFDTFFPIF